MGSQNRAWVQVFAQYENVQELDRRLLLALVDRILIYEGQKGGDCLSGIGMSSPGRWRRRKLQGLSASGSGLRGGEKMARKSRKAQAQPVAEVKRRLTGAPHRHLCPPVGGEQRQGR